MTRKFSITLPDDLAELLDDQENASAFIADALRRTRQREERPCLPDPPGLPRHRRRRSPDAHPPDRQAPAHRSQGRRRRAVKRTVAVVADASALTTYARLDGLAFGELLAEIEDDSDWLVMAFRWPAFLDAYRQLDKDDRDRLVVLVTDPDRATVVLPLSAGNMLDVLTYPAPPADGAVHGRRHHLPRADRHLRRRGVSEAIAGEPPRGSGPRPDRTLIVTYCNCELAVRASRDWREPTRAHGSRHRAPSSAPLPVGTTVPLTVGGVLAALTNHPLPARRDYQA